MSHQQTVLGAIFSQPWWLDAVAPDSWDEVTIDQGGRIVARLPYLIRRKRGITTLMMPPLTQALGPSLAPLSGKYTNRLAKEKQLMTELIDKLPKHDLFAQSFHHSITNWLPFYWKGFQQTTRYTYVLEDLTDLEALWQECRSNIKTDVRKAEKQLRLRCDLALNTFLDLNEMTFARQGIPVPYRRDLVARLDQACAERDCRRIFFAEDGQGRLHAAAYVVWDGQSAYYIMGGSDPELRNSGAMSLVMWEAIRHAATVTRMFDFEGSMIEPVERFFRSFGARQKPYFHISKTNSRLLKMKHDVHSWVRF